MTLVLSMCALLIAAITIGAVAYNGITTNRLHIEAERVMEVCAEEDYRPACYDREIPKVMDRGFSFEEAFKITRIIQHSDSSYWYCHVLGHNVSAKEAAKDIANWTDVVARCPQGMCSNGCLHGAFQERFRDEQVSEEELQELIPEIKQICVGSDGRDFTGLERASCYHALGHLTMYITNANINRAVKVCDEVAVDGRRDFRGLCYDGAYMQIFQPLEPEDIALVQDIAPQTRAEAVTFCSQYTGPRRTSCYMESWPLFVDDFKTEFGAMESFCNRDFSKQDRTRCLNGVFYVMSAQTNFTAEEIEHVCSFVSDENKPQCYANSASRFLETDYELAPNAAQICEKATELGFGESCYREMLFYSAYNYHPGTEAYESLCRAMPEAWERRCLSGEGLRMRAPFYDSSS